MASNQPLTLMAVPLEVRHQIFEHVAKRDTKPEKLLRYWFEKKEVKEKTAELLAKDPHVGQPSVVYEGDQFEAEEREWESEEEGDAEQDSDEEDDEEDEDEGDEEDEDGEDVEDEDEEEDIGDDEEENEAEEQDEEMADDDSTTIPAAMASAVPANAQGSTAADTASQQAMIQAQQHPAASDQTAVSASADQSTLASKQDLGEPMAAANAQVMGALGIPPVAATKSDSSAPQKSRENDVDAEDGAAEEEDTQMDDEEDEEDEENNGNEDADGDSDEDMENEDGDEDTTAGAAQPAPAPIVTAHRKWRHIPKFMRITHCPPPVELFLTSKQLSAEAKNWFYDIAILHIDATGSFAHTSFFEEAFSQITEAAFSPMEGIRKVEVTFVWDSTWLRSDRADCAAAIFPALLRQRAIFVTSILAQAPNLSEVVIHWHDSAKDEEAVDLMNDVLMGFLGLDATVKVETHYIAADAKPYRKSIAGKQRVEFQRIANNGLDRLF